MSFVARGHQGAVVSQAANVGNIDIDYQTNIRFVVNKHIKMHMTFHTIIDDNSSSKIQLKQLFGLGINYTFHEKVTY